MNACRKSRVNIQLRWILTDTVTQITFSGGLKIGKYMDYQIIRQQTYCKHVWISEMSWLLTPTKT